MTKKTYSSAFTKLILRVKKLEKQVKIGKARIRAKVVLSEDEDVKDDSFKQGRKLSNADEDTNIFLDQDDRVEWFQDDAEVQDKASNETEPVIQEVTPTEVIHDQRSSEKWQSEVSTAGATQGTASEVPIVSTAEVNISTARNTAGRIIYSRRSEETRKNKGKAIMTEPEPEKKSKKELELERLSITEAIRLQEQIDEEQRAHIARDEEIARQWEEQEKQRAMNKPISVSQARKNMITYLKNQRNYKTSDFKGMTYDDIRPIFEKVWDFNQHIEPMDSEHVSERMSKRIGQKKSAEKIEKEDVDAEKEKEEVKTKQVVKEVSKKPGEKKRKILARKRTKDAQDKEISKRQKLDEKEEDDQKDENITQYMEIVEVEEIAISAILLATKPPVIVDVEIVSEGQMSSYYIIRADEKSKRYSIMTLLFQDIDRKDLENLWKIIKGKFKDADKVYPLTHATITKMLDKKLQVDHQNEMAYQLLKLMLKQLKK
ncbi:hypothetical protein Tco_1427475 [Tanacetum coccineum]